MMNIIGINYGSHESAVAFLQNGVLEFAAAEERYTRKKLDSRFPTSAIQQGLNYLGMIPEMVDIVALSWPMDGSKAWHDLKMLLTADFKPSHQRIKKITSEFILDTDRKMRQRLEGIYCKTFGQPRQGFLYCNHHACHALNAYYVGAKDEATSIVFDGRGTTESTTIWAMDKLGYRKVFERSFPNSIGLMYAEATRVLGFVPLSDEWKVMGLAAYGQPRFDLQPFMRNVNGEHFPRGRKFIPAVDSELSDFGKYHFLAVRGANEPINEHHKDLAASVQLTCEKSMIAYAREAIKLTGCRDLVLSGGVALNCKANGEIARLPEVQSLAVQPAAGDDGTAIGAALYAYHRETGQTLRNPIMSPYLGTGYTSEQIEQYLRKAKIRFHRAGDLFKEVAGALAADQIVGWFQGRMEFGPRALGNRSILSSPLKIKNRDKVNEAVKFRELWRPFAPAVLHEYGDQYFLDYQFSPYMIVSYWIKEAAKEMIPAVTHHDGSGRVQSVTNDSNPRFYRLLQEFSNLTGVHVVMNTSFNLKGEPIVESPLDAIRTFYSSGLDMLVMDDFIVEK